MTTKWLGAAAWSSKEAHAGDRLPYARLVDENTMLLRDGSLMTALQVPGLLFETEDIDGAQRPRGDARGDAAVQPRCALRALPPRRPPQGQRRAGGRIRRSAMRHIDRRLARQARRRLAVRQRPVRDARAPSGARQGRALPSAPARSGAGKGASPAKPTRASSAPCAPPHRPGRLSGRLRRRAAGRLPGPQRALNNELLELVSALYNGEMRPVRRPAEDTDVGRMLPYRRASFGLDAMELRGSGGADFAAILSLKDYPEATSPGLLDALLRLPCEMVVSESFAPHERQTARERIDLAHPPPALGRRGRDGRARRYARRARRARPAARSASATTT